MKKTYLCKHIEDLNKIAEEILIDFPTSKIWAFFGRMGAGKTTFVKAICSVLKVEDIVCSPTFSIINEYFTQQGDSVYHFDFYRIKNLSEAFDIGYEEYFYSGNYCFLEWSEKIEELLPDNCLKISITANEIDNSRLIEAEVI